MSTSQTLTLNYSADGLSKLEVPQQAVQPGEPVRIYLWGRSAEDLMGYRLGQGAENLGPGTLRQYPGQITEAYFDLTGDGAAQDFDWPVLSLASVTAYGNLYVVDGNDVSLVALPGEDVTRYFRLSGNALVRNVEAGAPTITGSVRAVANRSPWCREWRWTAPGIGLPQRLPVAIRYGRIDSAGESSQIVRPIRSSDLSATLSGAWGVDNTNLKQAYGIEKYEEGYRIYTKEVADGLGGISISCPVRVTFESSKENSINVKVKVPTGNITDDCNEEIAIVLWDTSGILVAIFIVRFSGYDSERAFVSFLAKNKEINTNNLWRQAAPAILRDGSTRIVSGIFTNSDFFIKLNDTTIISDTHDGSIFNTAAGRMLISYSSYYADAEHPAQSQTRLASVTVSVS